MKRSKATIRNIIFIILCAAVPYTGMSQAPKTDPPAPKPYHKQLTALTKELDKKGYNIDQLLKDKRFEIYDSIGHRFKHSAERKTPTLAEYKQLLHFDEKIPAGVQFLKAHKHTLKKAQKRYHISPYITTAIIGIESNFGTNVGTYNPFNVYVSMIAVDYRAHFAKDQLKELLKFTHRNELDVFDLKSSYAGAMSYAQFIPYSVNKWFVGKDISDMDSNILSVANYLAYFRKRTKTLRTTILRYNPSGLYADTILDLADAIKKAEADLKNK